MSDLTHYTEAFGRFTGSALSKELLPLRKSAMERFSAAGFPTTRNEEWKYTSVLPITKIDFRNSTPTDKFKLTKEDIKAYEAGWEDNEAFGDKKKW